jgi:hypothetical protein
MGTAMIAKAVSLCSHFFWNFSEEGKDMSKREIEINYQGTDEVRVAERTIRRLRHKLDIRDFYIRWAEVFFARIEQAELEKHTDLQTARERLQLIKPRKKSEVAEV